MSKKNEVNVFLIGGTGHGKSFFLSMFEQVVVHRNLHQAAAQTGEFVIPTKFFHGNEYIVEGIQDIDQLSGKKLLTLHPTIYEYPTIYGTLRLIDTPGIGNIAGTDTDQEPLDEIISCMDRFERIHAILLFFKSSDNRFDFKTKYQLHQLMSLLGNSVVNNIHLVVTHVGSHSDIGDAGGVIEDFNQLLPVQIPCTEENTFRFENDPLKYIILKKQRKSRYSAVSVSIFETTYDVTRSEYVRLFKMICNCTKPYDVREYRALTIARNLWPKLNLEICGAHSVKEVITTAIRKDSSETKALLDYLAELEVNSEKTSSAFDGAVERFLSLFGSWRSSGLGGRWTARGALNFAGGTAAGVAVGEAVAFPVAAVVGATFIAVGGPALVIGGALGGLIASGTLTLNHFKTKEKRGEFFKQFLGAKDALEMTNSSQTQYERYMQENEQMRELEKDFARCLYNNALLAFTIAKEEYVKNEMNAVNSQTEKQCLQEKLEQLIEERAVFEQVSENSIKERKLLSPEELLTQVEDMCALRFYGKPMQKAVEASKISISIDFNVIVRREIAFGSTFHELFSTD